MSIHVEIIPGSSVTGLLSIIFQVMHILSSIGLLEVKFAHSFGNFPHTITYIRNRMSNPSITQEE